MAKGRWKLTANQTRATVVKIPAGEQQDLWNSIYLGTKKHIRMDIGLSMNTRRKFLFDCSAISVAALVAPTSILADAARPWWRQKSLKDLSCEEFAGQVNTTFRIQATPDKTIEVKLDEVKLNPDDALKPGQRPRVDAGHEKFSLVFSGRRSELIRQNTYTFEHDALGRFDLFVVPIFTRDPRKIDYQMVFNRPRSRTFQSNS